MVLMLLVWGLIGLIVGPVAVAVLPVVTAWVGGDELRERVGAIYGKRMMEFFGPGALVAREQGGLVLSSVSKAPKFDADRLVVDGEAGHIRDDTGSKGYLKGKEFGLALDFRSSYISPLLAELGAAAETADDDRRLGIQTDGGVRLDFEIPRRPQVPDVTDAAKVLVGSTGFRDGVVAEDWARKSQEKFHSKVSLRATLVLVGAFAAGVGLAFLLVKYGSDAGGGGGTTLPIMLGVL